jgi:S-(hydroxymethyl)glutathione dehydrogenase/alcohol dehydrogenase
MKAAICREFDRPLSLEDVSIADPIGHAIKVEIKACAICHSDITYMRGGWGGTLPLLLGHEAAGIVTEIGAKASSFKVGDRVVVTLMRSCGACQPCGVDLEAACVTPPTINDIIITDSNGKTVTTAMNTGAFAEQVLVHERQCIAIPDDLSFDEAALLGCGVITGFGAVMRVGKIKLGESVAILGIGGIGINCLQAARIAGASQIIAIDTAEAKEALARKLGATDFINPLQSDAVKSIIEATDGARVDAVFVAVGTSKAVETAARMIKAGGRIIMVGIPPNGDLAAIDMGSFVQYSKTIIGTKMGAAMIREDIPKLIALHQKGTIDLTKLISHRFHIDDINDAINMAVSPDAQRVVVTF